MNIAVIYGGRSGEHEVSLISAAAIASHIKKENKVLLICERIGEVLVSVILVIFKCFDPLIKVYRGRFFANPRVYFWCLAILLMILYECFWIRYFKSQKTMQDFYSSFAGFPVAGASLPVFAVLILAIYGKNLILLGAGIILGIGTVVLCFVKLDQTVGKAPAKKTEKKEAKKDEK